MSLVRSEEQPAHLLTILQVPQPFFDAMRELQEDDAEAIASSSRCFLWPVLDVHSLRSDFGALQRAKRIRDASLSDPDLDRPAETFVTRAARDINRRYAELVRRLGDLQAAAVRLCAPVSFLQALRTMSFDDMQVLLQHQTSFLRPAISHVSLRHAAAIELPEDRDLFIGSSIQVHHARAIA